MKKLFCLGLIFLLSGCASSPYYMEDKTASEKAVADLHASSTLALQKDIKVLSVSKIKGEGISERKKRLFLQKVRQGLVSLGKYKVVSYDDSLIYDVRSLRKSKEVNQKNIPGHHMLVVADANISGEVLVLQNDLCSLTLSLTNLKTGLTLWEGNYDIQCD